MRYASALAMAALLAASACGGSPAGPSGGSALNVRITDGPFTNAKAVLVTFSGLRAHRAENEWEDVQFAGGATTRTCDLKKLENEASDILGSGDSLPAGQYTQIRLVVTSATLYFDNASDGPTCAPTITAPDGATASLEIPSGEVKLNRGFELINAGTTTILLDFDGDRSIRETGNGRYMMSPVIGIVSVTPSSTP